jgi:S-adenosylmethionine:tRNA ribosyltransferase-isomerase
MMAPGGFSNSSMHLNDFSYDLPESLIAQKPLAKRTASRLMTIDRRSGTRQHSTFAELPSFLTQDDVLVVNSSKVLPARLFVRRPMGGAVEVLVTRRESEGFFTAIVGSSKRPRPGEILAPPDGNFHFEVVEETSGREMRLKVVSGGQLDTILEGHGHVPLPPYIRREDGAEDSQRYQTVYADQSGSVAAPTAGLHFDTRLLDNLRSAGIEVLPVTLHVGPSTFLPLEADRIEDNRLSGECFSVTRPVLQCIKETKRQGKRIVAVGTTVTRVLETLHLEGHLDGPLPADKIDGETTLFIYPGFEFRVIDRLITNFHLPRSSLLVLVSAFLGRPATLDCYREAVSTGYRFYSYGDAMLIH